MRRCLVRRNAAASIYDFVDSSFLNNKRPSIPGGAWPTDILRNKSIGDLQQIWFQLVKERNMLLSTREHYLKHQEELGAMPGPTRIKMVNDSMENIRLVMRERDQEATDRATAIFEERLKRGIYRYPPGPQPAPGSNDPTVTVLVELSSKVGEDRLRELFGKFDVFEDHKGIARISMDLTPAAWEAKQQAEMAWEAYRVAVQDAAEYGKWNQVVSRYDYCSVEIAPGQFETISPEDTNSSNKDAAASGGGAIVAADVAVPAPKERKPLPTNTVERLKFDARPDYEKTTIQLGYFPNITMKAPAAPPQRPVHPDEIEGPWVVKITYDSKDGFDYAKSLNITSVDGAKVLSLTQDTTPPPSFASQTPEYQEALRAEDAETESLMQWPNVPKWKSEYDVWTRKSVSDIVTYNYSNVVDYVDREVLLTGKSVWESPIEIDYTCGQAKSVPVHAEKPTLTFPNVPTFAKGRNL